MTKPYGKWYGPERYFGLHYDLHAGAEDTDIGARCDPDALVERLRWMGPEWVQTDCKGHPGMTSWFSQVPDATVSPGVVKDAMLGWREATRILGLPLHCHYSGIWDIAAGKKHPEWTIQPFRPVNDERQRQNFAADPGEKMCPRSPYLEQLMIPQMLELIDRYGVDGFWIDGDIWGMAPCYCPRCLAAWKEKTGCDDAPGDASNPDWPAWWNFTRESFEAYVAKYVNAVHAHKPGVLVCSNWLQTFANPGEPAVSTDWISGDNSWIWGLDASRCEARFLSTRQKPWDIMVWTFYASQGMGEAGRPWTAKPAEMLMQEAAALLSFGGNVQLYENPSEIRDGRLAEWRMRRWGEVGDFVKARREVCQGGDTLPQIAVLHSETHLRARPTGPNLMWNVDTAPVRGAVFALLEGHYGVDILDEWALLPRLKEFPAVVAPEREAMAPNMVAALKDYVESGGRLLVTGADSFDVFGAEFLGAESVKIADKAQYYVRAGDEATPLYSERWRLLKPTTAADIGGKLGQSQLFDDRLLDHPAAILNQRGRGRVAYIPADICRDFERNRYPIARRFINRVMGALLPDEFLDFRVVSAPIGVDFAFRRFPGKIVLHSVNRLSGLPNSPSAGAIDEIPRVGPIVCRFRLPAAPKSVKLFFDDKAGLAHDYRNGFLELKVDSVHIHHAVVIA